MSSLRFPRVALLLAAVGVLGAASQSCRPASYEILKPAKKTQTTAKTPDHLTPPAAGTIPPNQEVPGTPPGPVPGPTPPATGSDNPGPTARVEVVLNDQSITKVKINVPTVIRPTFDTVDPDDVGVSACVNPGIVKAEYDIGGESDRVAARVAGCEPLSVPFTFTKTGDVEIVMVVTSNEGEKALARMTLTVFDDTTPATDGGFTIVSDPMVATISQQITFVGRCDLKKLPLTIAWNFGDGEKGAGATVKHGYKEAGAHDVKAVCTDVDGKALDAEVTIVVVKSDKPVVIPGTPTPVPNPEPTPTPTPTPTPIPGPTPNPGEPGQNPSQKPDQKPGQSGPDLGKDDSCPCYDPSTGGWYKDADFYVPY